MPVTMKIVGLEKLDRLFASMPNSLWAGVKVVGETRHYCNRDVDLIKMRKLILKEFEWAFKNQPLLVRRFLRNVRVAQNGCWEWLASTRRGYGQYIFAFGDFRTTQAHIAAYFLSHGPFDGPYVLHECDNKPCVRPSHLLDGTKAENNFHKMVKGRAPWQSDPNWGDWARGANNWQNRDRSRTQKGSACGRAKLNELQVRVIRALYSRGYTNKTALGRDFDLTDSLIHAIVTRKLWRHI